MEQEPIPVRRVLQYGNGEAASDAGIGMARIWFWLGLAGWWALFDGFTWHTSPLDVVSSVMEVWRRPDEWPLYNAGLTFFLTTPLISWMGLRAWWRPPPGKGESIVGLVLAGMAAMGIAATLAMGAREVRSWNRDEIGAFVATSSVLAGAILLAIRNARRGMALWKQALVCLCLAYLPNALFLFIAFWGDLQRGGVVAIFAAVVYLGEALALSFQRPAVRSGN